MSPSLVDSIVVGICSLIFVGAAGGFLVYYQRTDLETKTFLRGQFDKLLVSALLMFSFFLLTHNLKYYLGQDSVINQTWGVVTFFLGMLSGLITGSTGQQRASDKLKGVTDEIKKVDTTITTATHIDPNPPPAP